MGLETEEQNRALEVIAEHLAGRSITRRSRLSWSGAGANMKELEISLFLSGII
uniref:Uncharacterized protein n=1 Tax=Aegilops tauschii TaxID=37682 RepID=M8CBA1_AEGTA